MSHRAVSGRQFGEQLKMFMTPDEIIEGAHKADSYLAPTSGHHEPGDPVGTPREQWEKVTPGGMSLRDDKLRKLDSKWKPKGFDKSWNTTPPVHLVHGIEGERLPTLSDGHHRLAHAERKRIPYMAVVHHESEDAWDEY